jgi:hypothetical protein
MYCSRCGTPFPDQAAFCSACGTPAEAGIASVPRPSQKPSIVIPAVLSIGAVLLLLAWLGTNMQSGPDRDAHPSAATGPSRVALRANSDWRVVSLESRLIEPNDIYSKYSWKLTIQNDSSELTGFQGEIEFLDADGFVMDRSPAYDNSRPDAVFTKRDGFVQNEIFRLLVPPKSTRTFSGTANVAAAAAAKVSKTTAAIHKESENELPAEN